MQQKKPQANFAGASAQPRRGATKRQPDDSRGVEAYHLAELEGLALILLLVSSIAAGMYASVLNTSTWFSLYVVSGTVAGLGTGLGVALLEACIVLLITGKAGRGYLKRAQIKKRFKLLNQARNFLLAISEEKLRLVSVLIIAGMAPAYWIARPLYVFSGFADRLPEYLTLAQATPPPDFLAARDRKEKEEAHDPDTGDGRDDDAPEQPQFGNASAPVDTNGEASVPNVTPVSARPTGPSHLPVTGKILPVDLSRRAIDPVYFDLSNDLRPRRPDEVGAIAALWWSKVEVGRYSGSGSGEAFQQECTVMVWDRRTKSLLAERSFLGGMPPRWSLHGFTQSGSRPYAAIRDFLNGLPRRAAIGN